MKITLAALLLAVSVSANEGGKKGQDPLRQACGADAERLCPGSKTPGVCLHEHWDEVSAGCKAFKEGMRKQWEAKNKGGDPLKQACGADLEKLCPGAPNPGVCLHEHWDAVSEGCKAAKEQAKKQWEQKQGGKDGKKAKPKD